MPIAGMDHFTILTTNASETVAFYQGHPRLHARAAPGVLIPRRLAL